MPEFPDVNCWIKVIEKPTGKAIQEGGQITGGTALVTAIIRFVVANDSAQQTGLFWVAGALRRNGEVKKTWNGQALVGFLPPQLISVQPNTLWKVEETVGELQPAGTKVDYRVSMMIDIGGHLNEEDEQNNKASRTFHYQF